MSNANNFISSVQTPGIRIRITGYSLGKPWKLKKKKKNMLELFLYQGKKATYVFFVLIIRFRQFGADFFSSNYLKVVRNYLKCEKNFLKNHFFLLLPVPGSA